MRIHRRRASIVLAGADVPSIMLLPEGDQRFPAALLLHGYSSSKERLAETMGIALAKRGIASLAIDLPLHGARDDALVEQARRNPAALINHWNTAVAEARAAIQWLSNHDDVDASRISATGYSLGSYIALQVAAKEPRIRSVIVAGGGDLPETPWTTMIRFMTDPISLVRKLDGRPLLVLHGKRDRTISPAQAQRLYDAAQQPKEITWYDSGHILPPAAANDAAAWLKSLS